MKCELYYLFFFSKGIPLTYGNLTEDSFELASISSRKKDFMALSDFKDSTATRKQFLMPDDDESSNLVVCKCGISHKRYNILKVVDDSKHKKLYIKLKKQ